MKFYTGFSELLGHGTIVAVLLVFGAAQCSTTAAEYGLKILSESKAYLSLPPDASGLFPQLLSQTGALKDVRQMMPSDGLIPYDLIVPFWSDGAVKSRWVSVMAGQKVKFAPAGEWIFPCGTVFVKTFILATNELDRGSQRRLETRLLVCDEGGGVYGVTYKWRTDNRDADRLETNLSEAIPILTAAGMRTQQWYYPSRQDCLVCHTANAGYVLGVKTRQLNRDFTYPSGITDN